MVEVFSKGAGTNRVMAPMTSAALAALQPSSLASPRVGNPHGIVLPAEYSDLNALCAELHKVQADIMRDEMPLWFLRKYWNDDWGAFPETIPEFLALERLSYQDPKGLAHVVHMDKPWHLFNAMHTWLLRQGAKPKRMLTPNHNDFLYTHVHPMAAFSATLSDNMEKCFQAKYYFCGPRPEELNGHNTTLYPEGCPTHPEVPAGHSVASWTAYVYFRDAWVLTPEQDLQLAQGAFVFSQARAFANMHFGFANNAGRVIVGLPL